MSIDFFPDFLGSATDEKILPDLAGDSEEVANVPCAVEKFFEKATLASALRVGSTDCNFGHVENLAVESQALDARLSAHYRKLAKDAAPKNPPAPAVTTSEELAKNFNASSRRKESLRQFLKSSIAGGETAEALITYAAKHDTHTANLLRTIAEEEDL